MDDDANHSHDHGGGEAFAANIANDKGQTLVGVEDEIVKISPNALHRIGGAPDIENLNLRRAPSATGPLGSSEPASSPFGNGLI